MIAEVLSLYHKCKDKGIVREITGQNVDQMELFAESIWKAAADVKINPCTVQVEGGQELGYKTDPRAQRQHQAATLVGAQITKTLEGLRESLSENARGWMDKLVEEKLYVYRGEAGYMYRATDAKKKAVELERKEPALVYILRVQSELLKEAGGQTLLDVTAVLGMMEGLSQLKG